MTPLDIFCPLHEHFHEKIHEQLQEQFQKPKPAKNNDKDGALKIFKVGANQSKVELETLKLPPKVIKTLGASISIKKNRPKMTPFRPFLPYIGPM